MLPILFMTTEEAKAHLDANKDKKIVIFHSNVNVRTDNHHRAVFSLFKFRDFGHIKRLLAVEQHYGDDCKWPCMASTLVDEIIAMVNDVSSQGELCDFNDALDSVGFDLSLRSMLRCAFGDGGKVVQFKQTLNFLNIESENSEITSLIEERYQYLTMQFSEIWSDHKERVSSPFLLDIHKQSLSNYDEIIVGIDRKSYPGQTWRKDAELLLHVAMYIN